MRTDEKDRRDAQTDRQTDTDLQNAALCVNIRNSEHDHGPTKVVHCGKHKTLVNETYE